MGDVTALIARLHEGDTGAFDNLFEILYPDLRRIAHARLARQPAPASLDTTSLVHECYLKFEKASRLAPQDRVHFLSYAAAAMRSIIVDAARASQTDRRGGGADHQPLNTEFGDGLANPEEEILDVHAALDDLARLDPRLARVVEMRYFGGMTDLEIAEALGVTDRTVRRDWEKARVLLASALRH